ncbi:MAG: acyl-CoA dehydrogenase family protein [Burkholderiales bacterium]|nr:acyl-CoA dehydrogenase family protein [Burkholderiales bacterium]
MTAVPGTQQPLTDLEDFRREVRAFLAANLSPALAERVKAGFYLDKPELDRWQRALHARGWAGTNWPPEHGGPGWTPMQKYVFEDECAQAGAPILIMMGLNQVAALLMAAGTEDQKRRHLPRILDGSDLWCQGLSEPNSGSDLASLKCPAWREGDEYVVDGSKIWTTAAHWANWCFLLVRTSSDGPKQEGITILLLDMKTPGITIRPIIGLDGMHSLNQLFLDKVRIPVSCRVGEEGRGWPLMKYFLGHERISAAGIWKCKAHFARLTKIARETRRDGRPLIENPRFRDRMAWLEIRMRALEVILLSIIGDSAKAKGAEGALLKLRGTELQQEMLAMMSEACGPYAVPFHPEVLRSGWTGEHVGPEFAATATPFYLFWRKSTISGGSSEIMRNVIAQNLYP